MFLMVQKASLQPQKEAEAALHQNTLPFSERAFPPPFSTSVSRGLSNRQRLCLVLHLRLACHAVIYQWVY